MKSVSASLVLIFCKWKGAINSRLE